MSAQSRHFTYVKRNAKRILSKESFNKAIEELNNSGAKDNFSKMDKFRSIVGKINPKKAYAIFDLDVRPRKEVTARMRGK